MAWSEGWPSTEETLQGMFGVGLICASVSLFVSLARWIFVAVTVSLRQPKDEHA
jgi:preprotein translocase subunit SecE